MAEDHDFKNFPELTNSQMAEFYLVSPHKQITGDFWGRVVKVTDGDTIRLETEFRDFSFPLRFSNIQAPEIDEEGGEDSQSWLENLIGGEEVLIQVDPQNRVEKWGRLLGEVIHRGININEESLRERQSVEFF